MMPLPAVPSIQKSMFACENPVHIVLIHSSLLSMFVSAGATSLVISIVPDGRSARRNVCAGLTAVRCVSTFALA
jgi:hypothetical protein